VPRGVFIGEYTLDIKKEIMAALRAYIEVSSYFQ
jgi:hypothetical protein